MLGCFGGYGLALVILCIIVDSTFDHHHPVLAFGASGELIALFDFLGPPLFQCISLLLGEIRSQLVGSDLLLAALLRTVNGLPDRHRAHRDVAKAV